MVYIAHILVSANSFDFCLQFCLQNIYLVIEQNCYLPLKTPRKAMREWKQCSSHAEGCRLHHH